MGDWGNNGPRQRHIAGTLARYVQASGRDFEAMLLAGDNFYVTMDGIFDPKWKTMFEDLYDPKVLDFPFYVALGNHDYSENVFMTEFAYAQANPKSRWKIPDRWYRLELPERENPLVSVLMLDSNQPWLGELGWRKELAWLTAELAKPRTAPWMIAVAHHPFFSNGDHGDNGVLQKAWGPLFEQAGLDLYICGHDHDVQHLQVEGFTPSFVLVGGGGATTRPMRNDKRGPFSKSEHGFAHLTFTPTDITVRLIGHEGQLLHEFTRDKSGEVKVTKTTPSDPAVPRTVRTITRPDATTKKVDD